MDRRSNFAQDVVLTWRGPFSNDALDALHGQAFGHAAVGEDWKARLERHSLGWVCAEHEGVLIGFVNLAWDGGVHAFILDTIVGRTARRRGIGRQLVALATEHARAAGCDWLHVDFETDLAAFYFGACGFARATAGVVRLR